MDCNTTEIVEWLADGARDAVEADHVLTQLCERLVACGIRLFRVTVYVRTLDPLYLGRRFIWRADTPVQIDGAPYDLLERPAFRNSPMVFVAEHTATVRRRLADADCPLDFPVLPELREEGVTDYLMVPLVFTNGEVHLASWTTRAPGGFRRAELLGINAIVAPLARVAEVRALRRTATNLLNTYVGRQAGERILAGKIRRGDSEAIHAAIWLSDMRGFTTLADTVRPELLIDVLNRYFDCQVPAIEKHGGEVLKFMGDGLLAIFPVDGDAGARDRVCADVLAAAREARQAVAALEGPASAGTAARVRCGIALHLGEVLYGNIGGASRLDFTCIGPGVNLAARLEKLTGRLGRTILASADFARHCADAFRPAGEFALAGFAQPQVAFGLKDEA